MKPFGLAAVAIVALAMVALQAWGRALLATALLLAAVAPFLGIALLVWLVRS